MISNLLRVLEAVSSPWAEELSMTEAELTKYLDKIRHSFDVDQLLRQDIDEKDVINYYVESEAGYDFFHSPEGSVHMALNFDGKFDEAGYYGQVRIVQEHIAELHPQRVLELGSGKGFNTLYLAKRNEDTEFVGIDITQKHLAIARDRSQGVGNLHFELGNFQDLRFASESFNLVFEVESICHANDMAKALSETYKVLKPRGRFIAFDGYRKAGFDQLGDEIRLAARLTEVAMAVSHPWVIDDWLDLAQEVGFDILSVDELSDAIMPNLLKFQLLARGYFKFPLLSRVLLKTLPPSLVRNSIAGLLMPFTIRADAQGYYNTVLERA